jgi:hypothetical protein
LLGLDRVLIPRLHPLDEALDDTLDAAKLAFGRDPFDIRIEVPQQAFQLGVFKRGEQNSGTASCPKTPRCGPIAREKSN